MQLTLSVGAKLCTCEWSSYALLRDNVQHFVERGQISDRFSALHAIEQAVLDGRQSVDAARLRGEVLGAVSALGGISIGEAAISLRTRAILTSSARVPAVRGTVRARQAGWALPVASENESSLLEAARPFIAAVLSVTDAVADGDDVTVERSGASPRFALEPTGSGASASDEPPAAGSSSTT